MRFVTSLLAGLAENFAEIGAHFGSVLLRDIAEVMSFLEAAGYGDDPEVNTSALAGLLLQPEQASALVRAAAFGSDLISDLDPASRTSVDFQLSKLTTQAQPRKAAVSAAILFVFYRRAARAGDAERAKQLGQMINQMSRYEANADLITVLTTQIQATQVVEIPQRQAGRTLFSISIDLVGSTDAKTRVMKLAAGDGRRIDELNAQIYRAFCKIEEKLYRYASGKYGKGKPIKLNQFFAVKGIGDEIWLLCESTPGEMIEEGRRMIDAALQVAGENIYLIATENEEKKPFIFDPNFDYGAVEPVLAPIKVFIDIIEHATDLGKLRDDLLTASIPEIFRESTGQAPRSAELAQILGRLAFGTSEATRFARTQLYRTDYIGHEIDRFFRATKAALPGTVALGERLAQRLGLKFSEQTLGVLTVSDEVGNPVLGGMPSDPIHAVRRTLNDLKGIGYDYEVYQLFSPRMLNGKYKEMNALRDNGMPAVDYTLTQKVLSPEQVQAAANPYYPKQSDDEL